MNNDIIKEVLSELIAENKNHQKEIIFLTKALETNTNNLQDIYMYLSNLKINIPTKLFVDKLENGINKIESVVAKQPKEILQEKKILLFPDTISNENIFRFLYKKTLQFSLIGLVIFLTIKYSSQMLTENHKYKQVYEYIYYSNDNAKGYLENLLKSFENDSISRVMINEIDAIKKNANLKSSQSHE
ncbi:hypothetical protein [Marinifilum sp. D737]|uniref:hypothetical protein n=1 Tax=Marinifilum sp. D737 TaxID=2969628 RepID=UPI0022760B99|nr:hypothetical protein [Marinifilum sp. D737]MCY1633915.1 hypothetical protein [Marinifilum sp. D737]